MTTPANTNPYDRPCFCGGGPGQHYAGAEGCRFNEPLDRGSAPPLAPVAYPPPSASPAAIRAAMEADTRPGVPQAMRRLEAGTECPCGGQGLGPQGRHAPRTYGCRLDDGPFPAHRAAADRIDLTAHQQQQNAGRIIYRCPNGHAINGPGALMGCVADRCAKDEPAPPQPTVAHPPPSAGGRYHGPEDGLLLALAEQRKELEARMAATPPPPTDTARRAQLRADILAFAAAAPIDELDLLVELSYRIERGRKQYGAWVAASEKRDLVQEEHEEHLDAFVYSSMQRVRARALPATPKHREGGR